MTVMDFPSSPVNGQTTTDGRYYFDSSVGSTGAWRSAPLPVGGLPAGSIMAWGTNTPPANWLIADGSAVSRSVYSSLFAVIGTQYGAGDGSTTFALPDLRGRVPVGKNGGTFGTLGATGGAETHAHGNGSLTAGGTFFPAGGGMYFDYGTKTTDAYLETSRAYWPSNGSTSALSPEGSSSGIAVIGSTSSASSLAPYQVVNYVIKASAGWTAGDSELATRLGAVETANATTNKSGLVPVIPSSVTVGSGSASVNAGGLITLSGATQLKINAGFPNAYNKFHIIYNLACVQAGSQEIYFRFRYSPTDTNYSSSYYSGNFQAAYSNSFGVMELQSLGDHGWLGTANTNGASNAMAGQADVSLGTYSLMNFHGFSSQRSAYLAGGCEAPTATRPDGFFIYTSGGSQLNGTIQVYGYR